MDKKKIVKRLFEKGILVTPGMLEKINEKNIESFIQNDGVIIEKHDEKLKIAVDVPKEKDKLSVDDFVEFYNEKFNGIRDMLAEKYSPVSINNLTKMFNNVHVIGIVKDHTQDGFIIEDLTGNVNVISKQRMTLGDVICIKGNVREGKLLETEIIYPDVPLPKNVKRVNLKVNLCMKRYETEDVQIIIGNGKSEGKYIFINMFPARVKINDVNILIFNKDGNVKDWLKKRHLPENVRSNKDYFLIKNVPDILWVVSDKNEYENYKGIEIIRTNNEKSAEINMFTRDIVFNDV